VGAVVGGAAGAPGDAVSSLAARASRQRDGAVVLPGRASAGKSAAECSEATENAGGVNRVVVIVVVVVVVVAVAAVVAAAAVASATFAASVAWPSGAACVMADAPGGPDEVPATFEVAPAVPGVVVAP